MRCNRRGQSVLEHVAVSDLGEMIEVFGNPQKAMAFLKYEEKCIFVENEVQPLEIVDEVVRVSLPHTLCTVPRS